MGCCQSKDIITNNKVDPNQVAPNQVAPNDEKVAPNEVEPNEGYIYGYKAFKLNEYDQLITRYGDTSIIYEVGKTYTLDGDKPLKICKYGYHFCKCISDVFLYYSLHESVVIKIRVSVSSNIIEGSNKCCTNQYKLIELLNGEYASEKTCRGYVFKKGYLDTIRIM
jgi:hypothetical protein